jgi:hypothetical protein
MVDTLHLYTILLHLFSPSECLTSRKVARRGGLVGTLLVGVEAVIGRTQPKVSFRVGTSEMPS